MSDPTPITDLAQLLAQMSPRIVPGVVVFATVPRGDVVPEVDAVVRVEEDEGTTLIIDRDVAVAHGLRHEMPSRRIVLEVYSSLEAVGLTAAVATRLAADGIPANVVAGFHHDHLFVPVDRTVDAMAALTTR